MIVLANLVLAATAVAGSYKMADVGKTPFDMKPIPEFVFPDRTFRVTDYGAVADGKTKCTEAFAQAIAACSAAWMLTIPSDFKRNDGLFDM